MTRKPVTSGNIKSIGFENGILEIEFVGGNVYAYTGPKVAQHFEGMLAAPSIGSYFHKNVRKCPETTCARVEA